MACTCMCVYLGLVDDVEITLAHSVCRFFLGESHKTESSSPPVFSLLRYQGNLIDLMSNGKIISQINTSNNYFLTSPKVLK